MSYREMIENVYSIIANVERAVQPGHPFHTVEGPGEGDVAPVDEGLDDTVRQFDIRMLDAPEDDGASGFVWQRFRVALELRVRYPIRPRAVSETMIGDDTARLVNSLISPSNYGGAIRTIPAPGKPRLEELINDNGVAVALLLRLPFEVVYLAL